MPAVAARAVGRGSDRPRADEQGEKHAALRPPPPVGHRFPTGRTHAFPPNERRGWPRRSIEPQHTSSKRPQLLSDANRYQVVARHGDSEFGPESLVVRDEVTFQILSALGVQAHCE